MQRAAALLQRHPGVRAVGLACMLMLAAGCGNSDECGTDSFSEVDWKEDPDASVSAGLHHTAAGTSIAEPGAGESNLEALKRTCANGSPLGGGGVPRTTLRFPSDAAFGTFDDNASVDIAVSNEGTDTVSIFLATGGSFAAPVEFPTGTSPEAIAAGDFDGGGVDLITANRGTLGSGDLTLLVGNDDGTFQAPVSISAGTAPRDVDVGHFNADAHLDIAVADGTGEAVVVRLGNGNGTFQAETVLAPGLDTRTLEVVDLNPDVDGHDDLVTNRVFLLGNGDGTFQAAVPFTAALDATRAHVGDLNEDGDPDIIVLSENSLARILFGNGDGTFQTALHYVTGDDPRRVSIVDLNADEIADLLISNFLDDHMSTLFGRGDGTLEAVRAYLSPPSGTFGGGSAVAVADFTGDDVPDVVAANSGDPLHLLPGIGAGVLGDAAPLAGLVGRRVIAGFWNDDLATDLAFTDVGTPSVANAELVIALGNDDGTFQAPTTHTLPDDDTFPDFLATALVNSTDAFPDLLVANTGTDDVSVFLGAGDGSFAAQPAVPIGRHPTGLATGHLNDDAHLDLVVATRGDFADINGVVKVALGNGDGTFQAAQTLRQDVDADSVVVADFNRDGDMDIAVAIEVTTFNWDVEILLGNGDGTFDAPTELGLDSFFFTEALIVDDADGDGIPDLGVGVDGSKLAGLRGRGDGTFEEPLLLDVGSTGAFHAVDLDLDGRRDLVTSSARGYVGVLLNTPPSPSPPGDHFLCWKARKARAPRGTPAFPVFEKQLAVPVADPVVSADPNDPRLADVRKPLAICNPADKNDEDPNAPTRLAHLGRYQTKVTRTRPKQPKFTKQRVTIENQLGDLTLELQKPTDLLVPTAKVLGSEGAPPLGETELPHFRCYKAKVARARRGDPPLPKFERVVVTVTDQLAGPLALELRKPTQYCAPANKLGEDPGALDRPERLVCYAAKLARTKPRQTKPPQQIVSTQNQFGEEVLLARSIQDLCIPSTVLD